MSPDRSPRSPDSCTSPVLVSPSSPRALSPFSSLPETQNLPDDNSSSVSPNHQASSRITNLESQLESLQRLNKNLQDRNEDLETRNEELQKQEMKNQEYLAASVEDYTKFGDQIYHLKQQNSVLQLQIDQKDAIIRALKREVEINEECHEHHIQTVHLQAAIESEGQKEGLVEKIKQLSEKLVEATGEVISHEHGRGDGHSTSSPSYRQSEPEMRTEAQPSPSTDWFSPELGAGSPSPVRPVHRPRDEDLSISGPSPVDRSINGGDQPASWKSPLRQQQGHYSHRDRPSRPWFPPHRDAGWGYTHEKRPYPGSSKEYMKEIPCRDFRDYGFCSRPGKCHFTHK